MSTMLLCWALDSEMLVQTPSHFPLPANFVLQDEGEDRLGGGQNQEWGAELGGWGPSCGLGADPGGGRFNPSVAKNKVMGREPSRTCLCFLPILALLLIQGAAVCDPHGSPPFLNSNRLRDYAQIWPQGLNQPSADEHSVT